MKNRLLLFLISILGWTACEPQTTKTEVNPEFLTFSFDKAYNEVLLEDIRFQVAETQELYHHFSYPIRLDALKATFSVPAGCEVTVNGVPQISRGSRNDFSSPVTYTVTNAQGKSQTYTVSLTVATGRFTGLPVLTIQTEDNKPILDKENWIAGTYSLVDAEGNTLQEEQVLEIRGRGNTTWQNPKKPYALKLDKKTELFGMPKHKRWVLLAAYNDKSMIRTDLAFHLAQSYSNLRWKQGGQLIELVLNGKFLGNYYLCEHIKIDENRVPDGYILEIDVRAKESNGDIFFKSERSQLNFVIKDPDVIKGDDGYRYVESFINQCEEDLQGSNVEAYSQYLDMESMVDWYLNSELTKNPDAAFFISVYMNVSADGKLYMGPLWDYDLAFGNQVYDDGHGSDNGYIGFTIRDGDRSKIWLPEMFSNPDFVALLKEKMAVIAAHEADIMAFIDSRHEALRTSALYNDQLWHLLCEDGTSEEAILAAYDAEIAALKAWLSGRIQWLSTEIAALD